MSERAVGGGRVQVLTYDNGKKTWVPAGPTGFSRVDLYENAGAGSFRIVGRHESDPSQITINSNVAKTSQFRKATDVFAHWQDPRCVFGLKFQTKEEADAFADLIQYATDALNGGGQPAPPAPAVAPPSAAPVASVTATSAAGAMPARTASPVAPSGTRTPDAEDDSQSAAPNSLQAQLAAARLRKASVQPPAPEERTMSSSQSLTFNSGGNVMDEMAAKLARRRATSDAPAPGAPADVADAARQPPAVKPKAAQPAATPPSTTPTKPSEVAQSFRKSMPPSPANTPLKPPAVPQTPSIDESDEGHSAPVATPPVHVQPVASASAVQPTPPKASISVSRGPSRASITSRPSELSGDFLRLRNEIEEGFRLHLEAFKDDIVETILRRLAEARERP